MAVGLFDSITQNLHASVFYLIVGNLKAFQVLVVAEDFRQVLAAASSEETMPQTAGEKSQYGGYSLLHKTQ